MAQLHDGLAEPQAWHPPGERPSPTPSPTPSGATGRRAAAHAIATLATPAVAASLASTAFAAPVTSTAFPAA